MRWYKRSVVFAVGLVLELIVATISCILIKENRTWLSALVLPFFAFKNFLPYAVCMEVVYLCTAASLALYTESAKDLPKGLFLNAVEGGMQILTLVFFFKFTYEITAFFLATATMIVSAIISFLFLEKNDSAGILRIGTFAVTLYLWTVIYCILMINFA